MHKASTELKANNKRIVIKNRNLLKSTQGDHLKSLVDRGGKNYPDKE